MMCVNDAGELGSSNLPMAMKEITFFPQLIAKIELPSHSFREQE